ncbi:MAG TPA: hypothetical protein DCE44_12215, partial [Verrucomicrobiales bacterium]|nr:hypothetical protein [Verrucomicrobiales bacterium]
MSFIQRVLPPFTAEIRRPGAGGYLQPSKLRRGAVSIVVALVTVGPLVGLAQVPPRFYWKSLEGANAVPVLFQSTSGNANPIDPAYVVSPDAEIDANVAVVGFAKMLSVFDRTLTLAILEPVGRISGETSVSGLTYDQDATGFGDPMIEVGINLVGPKAIKNIPDLLRYEPKLSIDL